MITAQEARDLAKNHPKRVIGFTLKRCAWSIEKALMDKETHADVCGNIFGGAYANPPRPAYLQIEKELKELGYEVKPYPSFFRPGIRITW